MLRKILFSISALLLFVATASAAPHKILYVDSYHEEYPWSAGITRGVEAVLNTRDDIVLKVVRMDTKRNKSEVFKKQAAMRANQILREWSPDVVIVSDDNAVKYLVEPFLNDTSLPVVFCGVNWNLDNYSLAIDNNVTGIIEIAHYTQLIETLQRYVKGQSVGYLAGDNLSSAAEVAALNGVLNGLQAKYYAVNSFAEWKDNLGKACQEVDMLLINNNAGISGWDHEAAARLVRETVPIPTGSTNEWMAAYNMVIFAKNAHEQGEWAAQAVLDILSGRPAAEIPVAVSQKANIYLNMQLAQKLKIKFPIELIERATFTSEMEQ